MTTTLTDTVARRADAGEPLARIEAEVVDPAPVDEEHKAALWLYAWLRTEGTAAAGRPEVLDSAA